MLTPGSTIAFSYEGQALEGRIVTVKDGEVAIKLSTGYNMLIPQAALRDARVGKTAKSAEKEPREVEYSKHLPTVTILHTGGTIASKVDYETGGVHALFTPEDMLTLFPEIAQLANIKTVFVRNMWSEDMRFAHYNLMAEAIAKEAAVSVDGIIVTHGTDLLHYSAAALSFAIEHPQLPIVIVGSQRSSDRGSSDSASNLLGALRFITQAKVPGVFVAMHEHSSDGSIAIFDGLHVRKNHSSRRDAFTNVNGPLFARVAKGTVQIINTDLAAQHTAHSGKKLTVHPFKEDLKVGLWKSHPQSFAQELDVYDSFDGLLIEAMGLGQLPINDADEQTVEHAKIREKIKHLATKIPVALALQTIYGRVNLNVYSTGRKVKELGVLGDGCDMHPETAFIKLAWLLSNYPKENVKELYAKNLRGEISARSPLEDTHKEN